VVLAAQLAGKRPTSHTIRGEASWHRVRDCLTRPLPSPSNATRADRCIAAEAVRLARSILKSPMVPMVAVGDRQRLRYEGVEADSRAWRKIFH
jgi:hypothetical protein